MPHRAIFAGVLALVFTGLLLISTVTAQFPTNSVTITSDPPPAGLPGQSPDVTLSQLTFLDPDPFWRLPTFNDSAWQPSFPVTTLPAWGNPANVTIPPTDFIWGGQPGTASGPRFNIRDTSPNPQYLFVRKNFCIPLNANVNSITAANTAFQIAASPGSASISLNGATVATGVPGDETGTVYNTIDLSTALNATRKVGRNTLAFRVRDDVADLSAAIAYRADFNYTIDAAALQLTANPNPTTVNTPISFNQTNNGLSGNTPYSFQWTFSDGTSTTTAAPVRSFTTAGTYTATLTMTDSFGCPSAPVTISFEVRAAPTSTPVSAPPSGGDDDDDDDDDRPTPTPVIIAAAVTATPPPLPTPTPGGPQFLPETGLRDAPTSSTWIVGLALLVALGTGFYMIRLMRRK